MNEKDKRWKAKGWFIMAIVMTHVTSQSCTARPWQAYVSKFLTTDFPFCVCIKKSRLLDRRRYSEKERLLSKSHKRSWALINCCFWHLVGNGSPWWRSCRRAWRQRTPSEHFSICTRRKAAAREDTALTVAVVEEPCASPASASLPMHGDDVTPTTWGTTVVLKGTTQKISWNY